MTDDILLAYEELATEHSIARVDPSDYARMSTAIICPDCYKELQPEPDRENEWSCPCGATTWTPEYLVILSEHYATHYTRTSQDTRTRPPYDGYTYGTDPTLDPPTRETWPNAAAVTLTSHESMLCLFHLSVEQPQTLSWYDQTARQLLSNILG